MTDKLKDFVSLQKKTQRKIITVTDEMKRIRRNENERINYKKKLT